MQDRNRAKSYERINVVDDTVYNPQSSKENNRMFDLHNHFRLNNPQVTRKSHDPVGYKKLETLQE